MTKGETDGKVDSGITLVQELFDPKMISLYFTVVEAVVLCRPGPLIVFTAGDVPPKGIWH